MWKAEEDFPRGGQKEKIQSTKGFNKDELGKDISHKKKDKKQIKTPIKKRKIDDDEPSFLLKKSKKKSADKIIETPLYQGVPEGLCVLGCVREASDYSVTVSLPGQRWARLPITGLGPAYTAQLAALAQGSLEDEAEGPRPIDSLLRPGQLLPVCVTEVTENAKTKKTKITVTCASSKINSGLPSSSLVDGTLMCGSVASVEDHGYQIDLGVKGLQAFLTAADAKQAIDDHYSGEALSVGQPLWCVLKVKAESEAAAGESRVVNVTIEPDKVERALLKETKKVDALRPGSRVKATITKAVESGLNVKVFDFDAVIHATQLGKTPSSYKAKAQLDCRVLYVDPVTKQAQLTALPRLVYQRGAPVELFQGLKRGTVIPAASISRLETKRGLYLSLPENGSAFAALSQLSDKPGQPDLSSFAVGQTHDCRVLSLNHMEGVAVVTLKPSILSQKFMTVEDLNIGDIIEVKVKEVLMHGVAVTIAKGLSSFIPCMHLADVPIKKPEKRFEKGQMLKCRVTRRDVAKSKVQLSHKKSIVKSKFPCVSDYSQLLPHMELEGVVIVVKERVVVVAFFGDVKGFVTPKYMSTEQVNDATELFYVGQVIRCKVVFYKADEKLLKLSFNFGNDKKKKKSTEEEPKSQATMALGKLYSASVTKADASGLCVNVLPGGPPAVLPAHHLSDFPEVATLRRLALGPKAKLTDLTYFGSRRKQINMTMKESFVEAAKENKVIESFSDLKEGQLHPATVKNHEDYGLFLEIAGGHTGLCPAKTLTSLQPASLAALFPPGASVETRLSKLDVEKQRFLGTLKVDEVYAGGTAGPLRLLQQFLQAHSQAQAALLEAREDLSAYSGITVGSVVQVTVSSMHKKGLLGELPSGAKALATVNHMAGVTPEQGKAYKAVVLHVDLATPCVELSLEARLVKAVGRRKENHLTQLKPGQTLKADVLLVKPFFVLMSLRGHGSGRLVYIPARKHINDVEVNPMYKVNKFTDVVIKESLDGFQLATLLMHDPEAKAAKADLRQSAKAETIKQKQGDTVTARVRTVHPLQLNLSIGEVHGRVHISEITDLPVEGENPLNKFHPEQELEVRVIGFRDAKTQNYLPLTKTKGNRILVECSLRQSKISETSIEKLLQPRPEIEKGDKVWVHVIEVSSQKIWVQCGLAKQGYIPLLRASQSPDVLNDAATHFPTGRALRATVMDATDSDKIILTLTEAPVLRAGAALVGQVTSQGAGNLYLRLAGDRRAKAPAHAPELYRVGQYVGCEMVKIGKKLIKLKLHESEAELVKKKKRKRKISVGEPENEEPAPKQKKKKKESKKKTEKPSKKKDEEQGDSGVEAGAASHSDGSSDEEEESPPGPMAEATAGVGGDAACLSLPVLSWDGPLKGADEEQGDQVQEEDDEEVKIETKKSKKKRRQEEEQLIEEAEARAAAGEAATESVADLERLVVASPSSSLVWLRYMAHHLALRESERARAVAERALETIGFREDAERQNVWLAYLQLELDAGDTAAVKRLLERAVQNCPPEPIYLRLADMYSKAGKAEEAEQLYQTMTRKFKTDKRMWKAFASFLFRGDRLSAARTLMQRCLTVLPKSDHVEIITRFARLEFEHGEAERGRTLMENLAASCPGRTDLWAVYTDMVAKSGDITGARQVLERATSQKMSHKKLSGLLAKAVRFEETHGTPESLERAKERATQLLEG